MFDLKIRNKTEIEEYENKCLKKAEDLVKEFEKDFLNFGLIIKPELEYLRLDKDSNFNSKKMSDSKKYSVSIILNILKKDKQYTEDEDFEFFLPFNINDYDKTYLGLNDFDLDKEFEEYKKSLRELIDDIKDKGFDTVKKEIDEDDVKFQSKFHSLIIFLISSIIIGIIIIIIFFLN